MNQDHTSPRAVDRGARMRATLRGRMPELDGLRGLAILIVIWHNAGLTWYHHQPGLLSDAFSLSANIGWVGVQLFFVLSGFLITGILLDARGRPRTLPNFYMRRLLRIFPLYFGILLLAFALLPALHLMPPWLEQDRARQIWYWTFLINWAAPVIGGGSTFAHFWSLAVEEQFYLLWPLLVMLCSRRTMVWLCLVLVLSALAVRAWLTTFDIEFAQEAAYQFTAARWDALAIGALLAIALRARTGRRLLERHGRRVLFAAVLYVVAIIALKHNFAPVEPDFAIGNQTIVAIAFALSMYLALDGARHTRWLRSTPLRAAGKYSYGMYVFHLPMIHVWGALRSRLAPWAAGFPLLMALLDIGAVLILSTLLALLSWRLIERPFLRLKRAFGAGADAAEDGTKTPLATG